MIEKRIPLRYVTRESMFLVINFYINCHYYMRDACFDNDDITQEQIVMLYTKISDNDFQFDEYDCDILYTTKEAYCLLEEN